MKARHFRWVRLARVVEAEEAYRIGRLNHLVPREQLRAKTMELARMTGTTATYVVKRGEFPSNVVGFVIAGRCGGAEADMRRHRGEDSPLEGDGFELPVPRQPATPLSDR